MQKSILVVEDDEEIQDILQQFLSEAGYSVVTAVNGLDGFEKFHSMEFHLLILDIMMPKIDGLTLCEMIRKESQVPIILLTALDSEETQIKGFELLVDDFVAKPFSMRVLLKRVENIFRRVGTLEVDLVYENIRVNKKSAMVLYKENPVLFTVKEYEILCYFLEHKGEVISRQTLLESIWRYEYYGDGRVVDTHIKNIRKKLDMEGLITIRGRGYLLNEAN